MGSTYIHVCITKFKKHIYKVINSWFVYNIIKALLCIRCTRIWLFESNTNEHIVIYELTPKFRLKLSCGPLDHTFHPN